MFVFDPVLVLSTIYGRKAIIKSNAQEDAPEDVRSDG
jgi:hypothetical protein